MQVKCIRRLNAYTDLFCIIPCECSNTCIPCVFIKSLALDEHQIEIQKNGWAAYFEHVCYESAIVCICALSFLFFCATLCVRIMFGCRCVCIYRESFCVKMLFILWISWKSVRCIFLCMYLSKLLIQPQIRYIVVM